MMKVHILQHVNFEGPGYILDWCHDRQAEVTYTRFYETENSYPAIDAINMVVILGGPMSVNDSKDFPWLNDEVAFIKSCIDKNIPLLGICMGAQLIARALGAEVTHADNKEIGWFPVYNVEISQSNPWQLFNTAQTVFHWHGEQFSIPRGTKGLLASEANKNQGFIYGEKVIALQFHLEATTETVNELLKNAKADLNKGNFIQEEQQIRQGVKEYSEASHKLIHKILDSFAD